jgi:hypothetical protein
MQALLAFLPRPEGGTAKVPREWAEASDWFVIFTLGTLLFLLGAFAMWAWLIWRRTTQPEPHIQLLMELEDEELAGEALTASAAEEPETPAPWEQSPDWWKKVDH